jgi:hypothetical protein
MPEGMMKTRKRLLANERVTKFNPSRPGLIRLDRAISNRNCSARDAVAISN